MSDEQQFADVYNELIDQCGVDYRKRSREVGSDDAIHEQDDAVIDLACKRIVEMRREMERLRHENRQMLDAAEELSIGRFSQMACFVTQDPNDPTKVVALEPSRVQGLYEEFRRKIEELGDWSWVREKDSDLAEARLRGGELATELTWVDQQLAELQISIRSNAVLTLEFAAGLIDMIRNRKGFRRPASTSPTPTAAASPPGSPSA